MMIRQAKPDDADRIAEIVVFSKRAAYRPIFKDDDYLFSCLSVRKVSEVYREDHSGLLVYDDAIIKGALKYQKVNDDIWELQELYIDPFFQNEGIGTQLVQALFQAAKRDKVKMIGCWVVEKNTKAVCFYIKLGFKKTVKRQLVEGSKQWEIYMEYAG